MLQTRVQKIKDRAAKIGLSLPQLCALAHVDTSTVYRWLEGRGARFDTVETNIAALEASLQQAERETFEHLQALPHLRDTEDPAAG